MTTVLQKTIRDILTHEGPMTVEQYMKLCLSYYYRTRDPLGYQGDFVTSPEISQMFGELIGLWVAQIWLDMGSPSSINWVELGPGRGTLTCDALRAIRKVPRFLDKLSIHLVETSPVLREKQESVLEDYSVQWHEGLENLPQGITFFIANEFFDALPIRQYVKEQNDWYERLVGLRGEKFVFGLSPEPVSDIDFQAESGAVFEIPETGQRYMGTLAEHIARNEGAILTIDYGYWGPSSGDTLQALYKHKFISPLEKCGEADLTSHVDFHALAQEGWKRELSVHSLSTQREFLISLGIEMRAEILSRNAEPAVAREIEKSLKRLTEKGRTGMGDLFKVLCLSSSGIVHVPALSRCQGE